MGVTANLPAVTAKPAISIAGFKDVYHVPRIEEALTELQGLGPKRVRTLMDQLAIGNRDDLEKRVAKRRASSAAGG